MNNLFSKSLRLLAFIFFLTILFHPVISECQWSKMNGPSKGFVTSMATCGQNIFAQTYGGGIFRSTDKGNSWYPVNKGYLFSYSVFNKIIEYNGTIWCNSVNRGIFKSTNNGDNWIFLSNPVVNISTNAILLKDNIIFAGTTSGLYISTNEGASWISRGLQGKTINTLYFKDTVLFAGTDEDGIYRTPNKGISWTAVSNNLVNLHINTISGNSNRVFTGTNGGMYYSTNSGANWVYCGYSILSIRDYILYGSKYYAATSSGVVVSVDNGNNWNRSDNGVTNNYVYSLCALDTIVYAGTACGVFRTTDNGFNWSKCNDGISDELIIAFTESDNTLFAGSEGYGVFKYDNVLNKWNSCGLENKSVFGLASVGSTVFAGTLLSNGIYRSTNYGINWVTVNNGLSSLNILSLISKNQILIAGTAENGIFKSSDLGNNWQNVGGSTVPGEVFALYSCDSVIYAGITSGPGGILKSTNDGDNWISVSTSGMINKNVRSLLRSGEYLFAGTGNGIYRFSNTAKSWSAAGLKNFSVYSLVNISNAIIAATSYGFYITYNFGNNWQDFNNGIGVVNASYVLMQYNNLLLAGISDQSVWQRQVSDIVSTGNTGINVPAFYSLYQNYPNPFNPTTNIKYQIANNNYVTLKIFNVLGKEIESLVNEKQTAGTYEVTFDASKYPSGVYFYKLEAGDFRQTKKMILVK